jgi:ABC-type multidrug transport system fused ATPase/permease subunit
MSISTRPNQEKTRRTKRSIDDLAADRTAFVIAHRLSTVRDADRILVIEDGQIVESWGQNDMLGALQQLDVVEFPGE